MHYQLGMTNIEPRDLDCHSRSLRVRNPELHTSQHQSFTIHQQSHLISVTIWSRVAQTPIQCHCPLTAVCGCILRMMVNQNTMP